MMETRYRNNISFRRKLGTSRRFSIILDHDGIQSTIRNCTAQILEDSNLEGIQEHIINAACQAHHVRYRSATKSLHVLTELWLEELQNLVQQGIPRRAILSSFEQALTLCMNSLEPVTFALNDFFHKYDTDRIGNKDEKGPLQILQSKAKTVDVDCDSHDTTEEFKVIELRHESEVTKTTNTQSSKEDIADQISFNAKHSSQTAKDLNTPGKTQQSYSRVSSDKKQIEKLEGSWIELSMKSSNESDSFHTAEDDDIGWYFEDGKIPQPPEIDPSLTNLLPDVLNTDQMFPVSKREVQHCSLPGGKIMPVSNLESQEPFVAETFRIKSNDLAINDISNMCIEPVLKESNDKTLELTQYNGISYKYSIKSKNSCKTPQDVDGSDDEFSACFDHLDEKANAVTIKPPITSKPHLNQSGKMNDSIGSNYENVSSASVIRNDVDDEFDACFEDLPHMQNVTNRDTKDGAQNAVRSSGKEVTDEFKISHEAFKQPGTEKRRRSSILVKSDPTDERSLDEDKSRRGGQQNHQPIQTIEERLKSIMSKKSTSTVQQKLAKSRHFRTIDTAFGELQKQENTEMKISDKVCLDDSVRINFRNHSKFDQQYDREVSDDLSSVKRVAPKSGTSNVEIRSLTGHLDNTLKQLLNEKLSKPVISASKMMTNSRHFKTIKNTVETLNNEEVEEPPLNEDVLKNVNTQYEQDLSNPELRNNEYSEPQSPRPISKEKLQKLVFSLSHGCDEIVNAVNDVIMAQMQALATHDDVANFRLQADLVHTIARQGAVDIQTVQGVVIRTNSQQLRVINSIRNLERKCLLIAGDLTSTFKHKGFKREQKAKVMCKSLSSRENTWLERSLQTIAKLGVKALLIQGECDQDLVERCVDNGIVILTRVPYDCLLMLAQFGKCSVATYLHLCNKIHISSPVCVEPLDKAWMDRIDKNSKADFVAVRIRDVPFTTTIFSHPVKNLSLLREEEFWHTLYRIRNTFKCGKMLYGGSITELHLFNILQSSSEDANNQSQLHDYRSAVYKAVARGFRRYACAVQQNTDLEMRFSKIHLLESDKNNTPRDHCLINNHKKILADHSALYSKRMNFCNFDKISTDGGYSNEQKSQFALNQLYHDEYGELSSIGAKVSKPVLELCEIFDDFDAKVQAWYSTYHSVCTLLNTDMEIVTGLQGTAFKSDLLL